MKPEAKHTLLSIDPHVFVPAPDGSHAAPAAKCATYLRKPYIVKIILATIILSTAPTGSHHGRYLNKRKPTAKHTLLLAAPPLIYITK